MKKISSVALALSLFTLATTSTSCKKKESSTDRKMEIVYEKIPFDIPIQTKTGANMNLSNFKHKLNLDSVLKSLNLDVSKNTISSISFISCRLTLENDDIENSLSNLSSISIGSYNEVEKKNQLYGSLTNIDDVQTFLLNIPQNKELKSVVTNNDTVAYRLEGNIRKVTTRLLACEAKLAYEIIIKEK